MNDSTRRPARSRAADKSWRHLASIATTIGLLGFAGVPVITANENQCVVCHLELEDDTMTPPAQLFKTDVHAEAGLSCTGCHGGDDTSDDSEVAMDPARGFIGRPNATQTVALCGKCHSDASYMRTYNPTLPTDQEEKYHTSGHGQALARGVEEVATCTSCHDAHGIRKARDPGSPVYAVNLPRTCDRCHGNPILMSKFGLDANVFDDYARSVHGVAVLEKGDVGSPACNDCHGSHGAQPPGVDSVHHVCGTCHLNNREYYEQSVHAESFSGAGGKECVTCHNHHAVLPAEDVMLGLGDRGICRRCHDERDAGGQMALRLSSMVDSLKAAQEEADALVKTAERRGMLVDDAVFELGKSHEHLIKIRTAIHAFTLDAIADDYQQGLQEAIDARTEGQQLLSEFAFRRRGLAVATLLTTIMIVIVVVGIRRLERPQETS